MLKLSHIVFKGIYMQTFSLVLTTFVGDKTPQGVSQVKFSGFHTEELAIDAGNKFIKDTLQAITDSRYPAFGGKIKIIATVVKA